MAGITCGTCKGKHPTVREVRACGVQAGDFAEEGDDLGSTVRAGTGSTARDAVKALRPLAVAVLGTLFPDLPRPKLRFALELDDEVHFFEASLPKRGKWAGAIFLSEQASDTFYRVRGWDRELMILSELMVDPMAAVALYGQELTVCGVCSRTLTDEESRARGIGPVCLRKNGVA